jgi:hypothetical protein
MSSLCSSALPGAERFFAPFLTVFQDPESRKCVADIEKKFSGILDARKKVERFLAQKSARSKTYRHLRKGITRFAESANLRAAIMLKCKSGKGRRRLPICYSLCEQDLEKEENL